VLHATTDEHWNPSDFAHHLSRRARGLPFWFSLATYGTDAYRDSIEATLAVARAGAALVEAAPHVTLVMEPELTVVLFRRVGWGPAEYSSWSDRLLAEGTAFITPTWWAGEMTLRLCIVNPRTSVDDVALIIDSLR
jgi:glutamate/tyrosine decarboxylase-like PLP-dependent enzyme